MIPTPQPNPTLKAYTLDEILRYRAQEQPDRLAYIFLEDGETESGRLTYSELDHKARVIAAELQSFAPSPLRHPSTTLRTSAQGSGHGALPELVEGKRPEQSGARALLLYPPGLEYIAAFFGCLYAGVIPVPAYPPRLNRPEPRLQAIAVDAQATLALTTSTILSNVERRFNQAPELEALKWVATEKTEDGGRTTEEKQSSVVRPPSSVGNTVAFLQYTSGSTAAPKGVQVSHTNLLHNLSLIQKCFGHTSESQGVIWLPPYHDMGLIGGILQPLYVGFPVTLMPPTAFLQSPARWLQAITRYRATTSGGPNFAYDLCVQKITAEQRATLDLGSWELAFNGAEPIRPETLERFTAAFAANGFRRQAFYPCYGLAEATLIVSGGAKESAPVIETVRAEALESNQVVVVNQDEGRKTKDEGQRTKSQIPNPNRQPLATSDQQPAANHQQPATSSQPPTTSNQPSATNYRSLVGCGQTLAGQKIVIVDSETLKPCPPDSVGEIWVSGPSVAEGYWNRPEETEHTFHAHLADTDEGPFLRTGDFGFLRDGELFVLGRLKDLLIIRGRNYYPQDIELAVGHSHPALRADVGAAFSVEIGGEERLVVVQEVERRFLRNLEVNEVIGAVRQVIAEDFGLQVYAVVLIETLSIPKTSSGKIQRGVCRSQFQAGSLKVVGEWRATTSPPLPPSPDAPFDFASLRSGFSVRRGGLRGEVPSQTRAEIEAWLIAHIARELSIPPTEIDIRRPFAYYGLSSAHAVGLAAELETWLGRRLPPTLAYDYPSIQTLARFLAEESEPSTSAASISAERERGAETEPIAIIGIGCRFPGAHGPEEFWQLLRNGVDAITQIPAERRWLHAFNEQNGAQVKFPAWGGFLDQIDQFDPGFFGITPREAARIDPQQRLLLQTAWEALEDAGQVIEQLSGTHTGVFVGISGNDYGQVQLSDPRLSDPYAGTGSALSIAANRLSYAFDFRGPSLAVDSACSSSLVAVHLASQSLRRGECQLALAGGVNIILSPMITLNFTHAGFMAADGRCKAFDARADGYVRGEGVGVVVLKLLSRALADGDPIYAVIRGSAVNNDGRSNGLTAPNRQAQEAVLREAYQQADVSPGEVQYLEAHGTGTALGDPIEAEALGAVLGVGRDDKSFCTLGSVKTNIGHLEAAAGIAGLIKTALALKHREIPPNLHFEKPNPHIPFDRLPLRVQQTLTPWPEHAGPALAGVSSFGFGGTNAHIVLEEAPSSTADTFSNDSDSPAAHLLPVSAHSPEALRAIAQAYLDFLILPDLQERPAIKSPGYEQRPMNGASRIDPAQLIARTLHVRASPDEEISWPDICYTTSLRRSHHDHRLALVAHSRAEAAQALQAFLQNESQLGLTVGRYMPNQTPRVVFVFSGQGPQWWAMGRELLEHAPTFRAVIEECDRLLAQYADWSLLVELRADEAHSRLNETQIAQPALLALQVGLAALWNEWGVTPEAVVGHSVGEIAAAHVAGRLSLEDAVRVAFHRGRLMQRATGQGKMAMVELSPEATQRALAGYEDRLCLAAINSPTSTVLSGDPEALTTMLETLQQQGIAHRQLSVDYAFHSHHMESLQAELGEALHDLEGSPRSGLSPNTRRRFPTDAGPDPNIAIFSTLTGNMANDSDFNASYWQRQIREPVRFAEVIDRLAQAGQCCFIEIGPHPVLSLSILECLRQRGEEGLVLPSLRRGEEERATLLGSLGTLYTHGYPLDWRQLYPDGGRCVSLPSYPWQTERYWLDTEEIGPTFTFNSRHGPTHPLLGQAVPLASHSEEYLWENTLDRQHLPYLKDHQFQGDVVLPGAAYVEMTLAAAAQVFGEGPHTLTEIEFRRPLFLPENSSRTIQFSLALDSAQTASFRIFSRADEGEAWALHTLGKIRANQGEALLAEPADIQNIQSRCREEISKENYYLALAGRGLYYGPDFQGLTQIWRQAGEALGEVHVPPAIQPELSAYHLHPTLLDAGAQVLIAAEGGHDSNRPFLPVSVDEVRFYRQPEARIWSHAVLRPESNHATTGLVGDVRLLDEAGGLIAEALGLRVQYLDGATSPATQPSVDDWLYTLEWELQPRVETQPTTHHGTWLIFADTQGIGETFAAQLTEGGESCVIVSPGQAYERHDANRFSLRPAQAEDIRQLFDEALGNDSTFCRGVVCFWGLDLSPREITAASLEADALLGVGTVVTLIQALTKTEWKPTAPRLWLVTRGTQNVGEESKSAALSQATLWGLGRTIAQEHPALWGGLIDLEPGPLTPEVSARLWEAICQPDQENQIAFRQGERYAARLIRHRSGARRVNEETNQLAPVHWRLDGSYLITGGLGGLGLLAAKWMVEQGARRVILLGRTSLPPRAEWHLIEKGSRLSDQIAAIRELEALGASVHLASVNVADEAQLAAFLESYRREGWPPIRGVVHAAGVLQDQILSQLDPTTLATVFAAKVTGGWLLHKLLHAAPLDFFVLFSSAAALLGSAGQGNYAAANAFLDALAHHRRAHGQPALSINWGPWAEAGMAAHATRDRRERLARQGMGSIPTEQGLELFGQLLRHASGQIGVMPINWSQMFEAYPELRTSPFLTHLAQAAAPADHAPEPAQSMRDVVLAAAPDERQSLVETLICEQVAKVSGIVAARLNRQQSLIALGIDSLMGIELRRRVEAESGVTIPLGRLLEGPTIAELAALLLDQIGAPTISTPTEFESDSLASPVVVIQSAGSQPPFFCIHPGALEPQCYTALAQHLGEAQPFYALQPAELDMYRNLKNDAAMETSIPEIVNRCVTALKVIQPHGPYFLGGWSLGGVLAFEIAQQLKQRGETVALLALFDSPAPPREAGQPRPEDYEDAALLPMFASYLGARRGKQLSLDLEDFLTLDLPARFERVLEKAKIAEVLPADADLAQIKLLLQIYKNGLRRGIRRLWDFEPQAYPDKITYFRAGAGREVFDDVFPWAADSWSKLTPHAVETREVPGDHYTMFLEPQVRELARQLGQCLNLTLEEFNRRDR